jgi:hypothetical protein
MTTAFGNGTPITSTSLNTAFAELEAMIVGGSAAAGSLTGTTLASNVVFSSLTSVGTITSGTWSGSFGAVSGANLTSLNATNIASGTIASARLPSVNIGTTSVDLTRASGALTLAGITLTSPTFTSPVLGTPASGNLANCTFPTLNQNTTGSAASLTTSRTIWGQSFNGTANVSGAITGATTYVGTGQLEVQGQNIYISGSAGSFVQHTTNTGSGNAAQWVLAFGVAILVRNTSTRDDKENIQPLNNVITPTMIDDIDITLWNRKTAPGIPEIGPMAEDMNEISPFLATHGMDIDDDHNIIQTAPNGINTNGWMSLLTIAIQDCRQRLIALETK